MTAKEYDIHREIFLFFVLIACLVSTAEGNANNTSATDPVVISLHRDRVNLFGYANFVKHENVSLNVTVALSGFVRNAGECAFICVNSSIGYSFNFAVSPDIHGRHVCEILATDKYNASGQFISKIGFNHYSLYTPCSSFPCMNGATCHALYEQGTLKCLCMPGFGGKLCEYEKNECASNPCLNSGICTDMFDAYKCSCHPGFSGDHCEIVAPGSLVPGGFQVCSMVVSYAFAYTESYHVTRGEYYTYGCGWWGWWRCKGWRRIYGKAYRTKYRQSYMIKYHCCPGFINPSKGSECTINIDECASNPCQNSGTCIDMVNGYQCNCTAGFSGLNCQINIDECSSNPCLNGGSCTDQVNGYACTCEQGYTGVHCETDINECASNPCLYGAACSDQVNGYTCTCAGGYTGTNCQSNINECLSHPCQNHGACNDLINGYSCTCKPSYTGTNCEIILVMSHEKR